MSQRTAVDDSIVKTPPVAESVPTFSAFWALLLLGASLLLFFGWQMQEMVTRYRAMVQVARQQASLQEQAVLVETALQTMSVDILELAKTDADARALVRKYNIQQGTPIAEGATPMVTLQAGAPSQAHERVE